MHTSYRPKSPSEITDISAEKKSHYVVLSVQIHRTPSEITVRYYQRPKSQTEIAVRNHRYSSEMVEVRNHRRSATSGAASLVVGKMHITDNDPTLFINQNIETSDKKKKCFIDLCMATSRTAINGNPRAGVVNIVSRG